ncbi:hypothetical protein ACFQ0G_53310 [Streptomyces chiangmaiensis]|uniref:hypothetical protein n=1 Tax=Streptomyces chiangmaiensis TaxID=766497 RepID=UPI0031E60754
MKGHLPDGARLILDAAHGIAVAAPYLAGLVAVGFLTAVALSWRRARRVRDVLAGRVRVEAVPTSTFDPSENEVLRWGHHLGRVSYSASDVPARGRAARLHYSVKHGRMHCYLEGPRYAQAVLSMPGFAEVEIRAGASRSDIHPVRFAVQRGARS